MAHGMSNRCRAVTGPANGPSMGSMSSSTYADHRPPARGREAPLSTSGLGLRGSQADVWLREPQMAGGGVEPGQGPDAGLCGLSDPSASRL